jgi:hypothetical protein
MYRPFSAQPTKGTQFSNLPLIIDPSISPTAAEDLLNQDRKVCRRIRPFIFSCLLIVNARAIIFVVHSFCELINKCIAEREVLINRTTYFL